MGLFKKGHVIRNKETNMFVVATKNGFVWTKDKSKALKLATEADGNQLLRMMFYEGHAKLKECEVIGVH